MIYKNHPDGNASEKKSWSRYSPEKALMKIKHYCGYQERSHAEVKEKLYSFGLWKKDVEALIAQLIEENYLNEERYAIQFAGGKFRMKRWGRVKIRFALKQNQVSEYCIIKALNSLDEKNYLDTLNKLTTQKLSLLKAEKNIFIKKRKLQDFLLRKGYEMDLVGTMVNRKMDADAK
jgi:regulatory protein